MSQFFMNQTITIYPDELKHILSEMATKQTGRNVTEVTIHCENVGVEMGSLTPDLVKVTIDLGSAAQYPPKGPMDR